MSPGYIQNSSEKNFIKTLIHEKVHVFQRLYPDWCDKVIKEWGFANIGHMYDIINTFKNGYELNIFPRNNPDLNECVYAHNDYIILQTYTSSRPTSIADSSPVCISIKTGKQEYPNILSNVLPSYVHQIEHPYEIMASIIPVILTEKRKEQTHFETVLLSNIALLNS